MGLDLSDLLWLQLLCSLFAMGHLFVLQDLLFTVWVLDHLIITAPFYQRMHLVTAGRHSLALFQKVLGAEAQGEFRGTSI